MFVYWRVEIRVAWISWIQSTLWPHGATTFCEKIIGKQELNCCKASFRFRNFRNLIHSDSLDLFICGVRLATQKPWFTVGFFWRKPYESTCTIQLVFHICWGCWGRATQKSWEKNPVDDHRKEPFLLVGNDLFSGRRSKVQRTGKNPCFKVISYNACMAMSKIWQLLDEQMSFGMIFFF